MASGNVWSGRLTGVVRLEFALFAEQGGLGGDVGFLVGLLSARLQSGEVEIGKGGGRKKLP